MACLRVGGPVPAGQGSNLRSRWGRCLCGTHGISTAIKLSNCCYKYGMELFDRIRANRSERSESVSNIERLDEELVELVNEALKVHSATEVASVLGVSRARVYQIRDGRR